MMKEFLVAGLLLTSANAWAAPGVIKDVCDGWLKLSGSGAFDIKRVRIELIEKRETSSTNPVYDTAIYEWRGGDVERGVVRFVKSGSETPPGGCSKRNPEGCKTVPHDDEYRGEGFLLSVPVMGDSFFTGHYVWGWLTIRGQGQPVDAPVVCLRQ